jgi:LPS-assembly protein
VIEPIAQVFYSRALGDEVIPNEDSQLPELDRSNLFSGDRFPGRDRVETGLRANLGVSYTLRDADGWVLSTTFGQVVRDTRVDDFSEGTGLAGRWSDYVGAVALEFPPSFRLVNRALFDPENGIRRNEFAFAYEGDRGAARATYVYIVPDLGNPILGPQPETNDVSLDARYRLLRNWEIRANWRFDAATGRTLRAGGGIAYGNDCAVFDLSASRRNTSSSNVPPATTVGFSVRLAGLGGTDERAWPVRPCARLSR